MSGKDPKRDNDLDKWLETQRAEITKLRDELLNQGKDIEKDLRSWTEDASSSIKGPFERFKNFVDSNFSTLSDGFRNFPSNVSELKARMQQEREARQMEEREIWRRWTGSEDSPDHIRMQIERSTAEAREVARDSVMQLLRQAYEKNRHVPAHKILDLYRDNEWSFGGLDKFAKPMLSFGGACYYKSDTVDNLPSTARWGWPVPEPQWLSVDWFKRSPYSPVRLEAYPGLQEEGSKWRAAFEDLLSASLDKPMVSDEVVGIRTPHGKPQSSYYGPGLEWMLSLQCRGILPPQLPSLYKPVSLFDGFDEVNRPRTAAFTHNIKQILDSRSATVYPLVKRDLEALTDEVSIKSGPETEAAPLRSSFPIGTWRVPETEEELYDEMPPYEVFGAIDDEDDEVEEDEDEDKFRVDPRLRNYVAELKRIEEANIRRREQAYREREEEIASETKGIEDTRPARPEILAQLTTTKTTRLPDGTVTTTVTLKERFADGREEEKETVHISRGQPSESESPAEKSTESREEPKEKKKSGWFWS